ncbi:MAG: hypothetical protein WCR04_11910, partial [Fibrobacteraceae bacterium]
MNNKFKSGVSLITVLLFMLTATIAATAVYKWITSASMASADRLKHTEVYLASESGVETLRSWLEYHGADAGALIKEYTDNDRYPICMDSILRPLAGVKSENFSVYLVGVDVASYPYKLKFVSTGTSRNSSKYSQVVIFDVNGLYQVKIPTDDSKINFTQAFYGLAGTLTDQTSLSSAIINGNVTGNTPSVTGNLLITGNYSNGGSTTVGGDLYVGGTFSPNSQTIVKGDCYFGSTVTISSSGLICMGDAYFNGNVSASGGYIDVKGNATFNGSVYTGTNSSYYMNVNGNVVMGASGVFNLIGSSGAKLNVGGSTWSPNEFTGTTGGASGMIVKLGDSTTASNETYLYAPSFASSLRTKDGYPGYYKTTSVSGSDTTYWVYSKSVYKGAPSGGESAPFEGGDSLSSYTKLLSDSTSSCVSSGTKNVPDPIIFKDSAIWLGYANPSICALPTTFGNDFVTKLTECYNMLNISHRDALYNGFLVVRMTVSEKKDPSGTLDGKFIIILDASNQQVSIPPTTSTSAVMLYLPKGAYQLLPGPSDASDAVYNYLIYSKGDISQIQNFSGTIQGSIFMAECSKVGQIQGSLKASYNENVLNALASAGVIQNNPKYNSGSDSTSTSTTGSSTEKNDPYYIPISPRLRVTLESEYTNNEFNADTLSQAINVDPSIIV